MYFVEQGELRSSSTLTAVPDCPTPDAFVDLEAVRTAVDRGREVLWRSQQADGSWEAPCDCGPVCTAQVLVLLRFLGRLDPRDAVDGGRWLVSQQRDDGSFVGYPFAKTGDLGATAICWAALYAAGMPEDSEPVSRARAFVERKGGTAAVVAAFDDGYFPAFFLGMAGLIDPQQLPKPPLVLSVLPPMVRRFLESRFHPGIFIMLVQMGVLARCLQNDWGPYGDPQGFRKSEEGRRSLELLDLFFNRNGSANNCTLQTVTALAALHAIGLPRDDDRLVRGMAWLKGRAVRDAAGLRFNFFDSTVWTTAWDVRALLAAGETPHHPGVVNAIRWLVESQNTRPQPEMMNRHEGAPRTGGWSFQPANETMADCDDTAVAVAALGMGLAPVDGASLDESLAERARESVARGRDWLLGMQNPDGGWSAYVYGQPSKPPGPLVPRKLGANFADMVGLVLNPPPDLADPATEDVTARVLHALGLIGYTTASPAVARGIEFLKSQQCASGAWWGKWTPNYLAATAFVLQALESVGADMQEPWVRRAVRWVLDRQNADGGWGEGPESYRDASLAGVAPSMPPLTGLVLSGLIAAGEGMSPAVTRGVRYLVDQQTADGIWPNGDYLHTYISPDRFYYYSEAPRFLPLEALGRYVALHEVRPARRPDERLAAEVAPRWPDGTLDRFRQEGDVEADAAVRQVFDRGAAGAVNGLLARFFTSDDPIPPDLPPALNEYFRRTASLPEWADPIRLELAQRFFARRGWELALGLFCSALPQGYAAAKCARVLAGTQAMTRHTRQRIFETAQFLFDVFDEGALDPGGRGVRACQKLRLMHAAVRHLTLRQPDWDESCGVPVNQEDMAGTLVLFSYATLESLQRLYQPATAAESDAWLHAWAVVGHLLGVREDLLPRSAAEAAELLESFRRRHWAPSPEGRELGRALVEMMQSYYPKCLAAVPVALVRYLAGARCADSLGLPSAGWGTVLGDVVTTAGYTWGTVQTLGPSGLVTLALPTVLRTLTMLGKSGLAAGQLWHDARVALAALLDPDGRTDTAGTVVRRSARLLMRGIVDAERDGKRAKFRIPPSLLQTVDPRD